jgi:diguanylate cyclase (GGDEF)-like protein
LLVSLAELVRKTLRPTDLLSRWSGQEFLCLLPNTDKSTTEELAERLRAAIEAASVSHAEVVLQVTASFATACYPKDGNSSERLQATLGAAAPCQTTAAIAWWRAAARAANCSASGAC